MSDKFTYEGHTFKLEVEYDTDMRAPWEECDGYGEVSDWTTRDKKPGERVLSSDRYSKRYYDVQASIEKATREGWGLGEEDRQKLAQKLGRQPTQKEIVAQSVEQDFECLRRWCANEWYWAVLHVWMADHPEHETYLGGVEYDPWEDYHEECAREMASEVLYEYRKATHWQTVQNLGVAA